MGQIQTQPAENDAHRFFPVPPHADGRGAPLPLLGTGFRKKLIIGEYKFRRNSIFAELTEKEIAIQQYEMAVVHIATLGE